MATKSRALPFLKLYLSYFKTKIFFATKLEVVGVRPLVALKKNFSLRLPLLIIRWEHDTYNR